MNGYFLTPGQSANFGAAAGDIATFSITPFLPSGVTTYRINSLRIGKATGTLAGSTVSLFTAAGGLGTAVISSTATTVTTAVIGSTNSYQVISQTASAFFNSTSLFLHITTSTTVAQSATVVLAIEPIY